jgi:anti-sigma B factor antagonist
MKLIVDGDTISIAEIQELGAGNCQAFRDRVYSALPRECRNIEVDLSRTDYVDSCGLGALISLRKMASSRQGKVQLLNPTPRVQLLFDVTRMHRLFEIVNRTQAAELDGRSVAREWAVGGA